MGETWERRTLVAQLHIVERELRGEEGVSGARPRVKRKREGGTHVPIARRGIEKTSDWYTQETGP
jgi:hypothetical protein